MENAQLVHNHILLFVAAEIVRGLEQSEATNDSVTITWEAPSPLNSVVGYAVLVYDSDGDMNCRTVTILDCDTCEVCVLLYGITILIMHQIFRAILLSINTVFHFA